MNKDASLSHQYIEAKLEVSLDVEFTFIDIVPLTHIILQLDQIQQHYLLDWVSRIASTNTELSHQFLRHAVNAQTVLDQQVMEGWALHAMDLYDQSGLHAALEVIRNVDQFVQLAHERSAGSVFEDNVGVLTHFLQGLSGRSLKLVSAEYAYTDSETVFLPPLLATLPTQKDNFLLYKSMVAYLWAQTRFGTFQTKLSDLAVNSKEPETFLRLFHCCESVRLEACIQRELPGLYRDMLVIKQQLKVSELPDEWRPYVATLSQTDTTIQDVVALTQTQLKSLSPYTLSAFHGELQLEAVDQCMEKRLAREKVEFRTALAKMKDELKQNKPTDKKEPETEPESEKEQQPPTKFTTEQDSQQPLDIELLLDEQPVAPPEDVKQLITSIMLDFGEIPDEYLVPAGDGEYDISQYKEKELDPDEVWQGTYHEEGAFLYQEWDYRRQHYRKNWCAVREKKVTPVYNAFVTETLQKYRGLIKHLRKTFEAMLDEDRLLKRQVNGDGIDIDALVEALADAKDGSEMSDRVFTRMHRTERNIAVIFMVDMSGSTKGWINDAERESLIILAETLETLGDRYAIYGFSGMARKRCEIFVIKEFEEPYNEEVKARITGIEPQDYTRMGFAIRHLTHLLNQVEARTRILITLSDGKPDDYDSYKGQYAIEDTRRALVEARRVGIHPYCITIDNEAKEYLPHMYGVAAYTVLDEVRQLPQKISDIYRKLTT